MCKVTLKEIKKIINDVGLNAEFRTVSSNKWSDIVNNGIDIPVFFIEHYVDYQIVVFNHLSKSSMDISLVLSHDNKPCAIWPLALDLNDKEPIKSINNHYGGVVIPPLFVKNFPKKSQRLIIKACIKFLNKILEISQGKCWRTNELYNVSETGQWHQIILEMGGKLDKINYEMYVDLTLPIKEIRSHIRKSFRPLVSSGLKTWKVMVMDKYCLNTWENFRKLHKRVAGRITRPKKTWDIQHEAIRSGNAFLVYVTDFDKKIVGGGYFDMSEHQCNYSVGTYDRSLSDQPLGHMIQYQAILTAKEKGKKLYYIGDRFYREDLPHITEKRVQISYFQQGFSNKILPRIGLIFHNKK